VIFKSPVCFESGSRAGAPTRAKTTSEKKATSDKAEAKPVGKKRSQQEKAGDELLPSIDESQMMHSDLDATAQAEQLNTFDEENVGMTHAHTEPQRQHNAPAQVAHDTVDALPHGTEEMYDEQEYYEDDLYAVNGQEQYAGQNQIVLTLSYSLMNQVKQTARMEGVLPEDILIELIAEGVTRRAFEDAQRPAPSHLMTRTGYVAPDANGNVHQPQLSHHGMQGNGNNRGNHNGHNNRRFNQNNNNRAGNHFQGRNRQNNHFKNKPRNGK